MERLIKYFPELTSLQQQQFSSLQSLYREWNEKINVISRKDIDQLYERHVLHSLAIAKFISFKKGSKILDVGTGGGLPGIPLAILFPGCDFHLADSIGKKITVVNAIVAAVNLKNVSAEKMRAEDLKDRYDFIVSRAVAPLKTIHEWTKHLISAASNNAIPNGWLCLKGGDLKNEIKDLERKAELISISNYFTEEFFNEKLIVYFN